MFREAMDIVVDDGVTQSGRPNQTSLRFLREAIGLRHTSLTLS